MSPYNFSPNLYIHHFFGPKYANQTDKPAGKVARLDEITIFPMPSATISPNYFDFIQLKLISINIIASINSQKTTYQNYKKKYTHKNPASVLSTNVCIAHAHLLYVFSESVLSTESRFALRYGLFLGPSNRTHKMYTHPSRRTSEDETVRGVHARMIFEK